MSAYRGPSPPHRHDDEKAGVVLATAARIPLAPLGGTRAAVIAGTGSYTAGASWPENLVALPSRHLVCSSNRWPWGRAVFPHRILRGSRKGDSSHMLHGTRRAGDTIDVHGLHAVRDSPFRRSFQILCLENAKVVRIVFVQPHVYEPTLTLCNPNPIQQLHRCPSKPEQDTLPF